MCPKTRLVTTVTNTNSQSQITPQGFIAIQNEPLFILGCAKTGSPPVTLFRSFRCGNKIHREGRENNAKWPLLGAEGQDPGGRGRGGGGGGG